MQIDISKNELYITGLENVLQNYIPTRKIPNCRKRSSDAFVYILNGSCKYCFPDKYSFEARQGDILYLAHNAVYSMDVKGRYEFIVADFFFAGDEPRQSDVFTPKDSKEAEHLFFRLLRRYAGGTGSLAGCMSLLYQIYSTVILSRTQAYLPSELRAKVEEAKSEILANFASPGLSVAALAQSRNMSETYFRTLFRKSYGVSPVRFITDCRLSLAKELLNLNYMTLDELAERCGFSSASYFCRVFKKNLGITPMEYKKLQ